MLMETKRVATLYRVSTKGQMDGNDIPLQENACRDFIGRKEGWKLVKEYVEKGVSGFKVSEKKRDVIQQAKEDAENKLYDILLVFMFDRLGRIDNETPFVLEWFVEKGIEMWSVMEGQQKIEQHTDRLVNYLRFWQSSGESRKTSERVNEKHKQMVKEGIFRGGGIPYGYKGVPSGSYNKKKKELLKIVINEEESECVKLIFRLASEEGYGQLRIAKYLNEKTEYKSSTGKKWGAATINTILKNPTYKGFLRYDNILSNKNIPELTIVNEIIWDRVQEIRSGRKKRVDGETSTLMSTKGELLLIGVARCGHCGSRLTSTVFSNKYRNKNGENKEYPKYYSYRCIGKTQNKTDCDGQTTYSKSKVEEPVLNFIYKYLDTLRTIDYTAEINKHKSRTQTDDLKNLNKLQSDIEEMYEELSVLKTEVPKAIMKKSSFTPEFLSELIQQKEADIEAAKEKINSIQTLINSTKNEIKEAEEVVKLIPVWRDVFKMASNSKQKMMLNLLIENVTVSRDEIKIIPRTRLGIELRNTCETNYGGRAPYLYSHIKSILKKSILIAA